MMHSQIDAIRTLVAKWVPAAIRYATEWQFPVTTPIARGPGFRHWPCRWDTVFVRISATLHDHADAQVFVMRQLDPMEAILRRTIANIDMARHQADRGLRDGGEPPRPTLIPGFLDMWPPLQRRDGAAFHCLPPPSTAFHAFRGRYVAGLRTEPGLRWTTPRTPTLLTCGDGLSPFLYHSRPVARA